MITISLLNIKGGVGKTTVSLNIAAGLADKGFRVLLIDYDRQGNVTDVFYNDPEVTIADVLMDKVEIKDAIFQVSDNLSLIASSLDLSEAEPFLTVEMQKTGNAHKKMRKYLNQIQDQFDYCIIDCHPDMSILVLNAMDVSDFVIIPIKPGRGALKGFNITMNNLNFIHNNFGITVDYAVLFNNVSRGGAEKSIIDMVKSTPDVKVFEQQIRSQPNSVAEADIKGKMIIRKNPLFTPVANDFRLVVDEIIGRFPNAKE